MAESGQTEELDSLISGGSGEPLDAEMAHALMKQVHDSHSQKDGLLEKLVIRLRQDHIRCATSTGFMNGLLYNLALGGAARAGNAELVDQLLFESTVLGVPLDLQT